MNLSRIYARLPQELTAAVHAVRMCARALNMKTWLVGGIVRDMLMERQNYDLDICVEGDAHALADAVAARLNVPVKKYAAFTTATVECSPYPIDLAMCREETYEKPGALPKVTASTLVHDLKRRDFSINAIAMSLNEDDFGDVIDPYEGWKDIKQQLIRVLHNESFVDDPTRLFRGVRFKERFEFAYERRTNRLVKEAVLQGCLRTVSPQRVRNELTLIAQEAHACECVRALYRMTGFSFLPGVECRESPDLDLLARVRSLAVAQSDLSLGWLIFAVLFFRSPSQEKEHMAMACNFTKAERMMFVKLAPQFVARLEHLTKAEEVDKALDGVSREGIILVCAAVRSAFVRNHIVSLGHTKKGR